MCGTEEKATAFFVDTYFREGFEDFAEIFGDFAEARSRTLAAVLFKPEALVGRRVEPALGMLAALGFEPIASAAVTLDRVLWRELWRFQLNSATRDRLRSVDRLLTRLPSLYVIFEDREPDPGILSTLRLKSAKGPAALDRRLPTHIRTRLGAGAGLVNFLHSADHPGDLVRELGLLFEEPTRRRMLLAARDAEADGSLSATLDRLHAAIPEGAVSIEEALSVVTRTLPPGCHLFRSLDNVVAQGWHDPNLHDWLDALEHEGVSSWTAAVLGGELVRCNEDCLVRLLIL